MADPDDATSRPLDGDGHLSDPPPGDNDDVKPLRQRIADRWNGLGTAGKAGVIGAAVLVAGAFLTRSEPRTSAVDPEQDSCDDMAEQRVCQWTNHAGGYYVCSHRGCSKKARPLIADHDCCGRCWHGRDCLNAAYRDYDGPGDFPHPYFETLMYPGVCDVCGEPSDAH